MFILLLLAAAATPVLHIDAAHDSGLPCPAYSALRTRLQTLDPEALEENPGSERLELSLTRQIGGWKLRLNQASGAAALERNLELGETDCPLVAESAALVIDRYLAALREPAGHRQLAAPTPQKAPPLHKQGPPPQTAPAIDKARPTAPSAAPRDPAPPPGATPAIPIAPPPAPRIAPSTAPSNTRSVGLPPSRPIVATQTISPSPPAAASTAARPAPPVPAPIAAPVAPPQTERQREIVEPSEPLSAPDRGKLSVALGPAGIVGLPSDLRAALWLDVEHPIALAPAPGLAGMPISLTTRFVFLGSASSSQRVIIEGADRGDISARSSLLAVAGGPCATQWLRFCASAFAGARLISGGSEGTGLFARSSALLAQPELGAILSMDRPIGARFQLRVSLLAGAAPGSAAMSIEGGPVRHFSTVDVAAALVLGYQIF